MRAAILKSNDQPCLTIEVNKQNHPANLPQTPVCLRECELYMSCTNQPAVKSHKCVDSPDLVGAAERLMISCAASQSAYFYALLFVLQNCKKII